MRCSERLRPVTPAAPTARTPSRLSAAGRQPSAVADSRTLLWWYLSPFLIGMCVSTWGMRIELTARIGVAVMTVLFAVATYWLNRRVWRSQWVPLQRELEALLNPDQSV